MTEGGSRRDGLFCLLSSVFCPLILEEVLGLRSATTSTFAFELARVAREASGFTLHPSHIYGQRPVSPCGAPFTATLVRRTQGYRIKPHGQLVSVSLTHYCASTPDLSTRWSAATLQVTYITGRLILRQVSRL